MFKVKVHAVMRLVWAVSFLAPVPLCAAGAVTLNFEDVMQAALSHSHEIRMSTLDIGISRSQVREAKSAYFPTLSARFNSQYSKDLTNTAAPQVTAVGETVFAQNTFFQNSFSLNTAFSLYDFGVREGRVFIAEKDVPLKEAVRAQSMRDTKIRVLEIYRDLLVATNDLASKQQLLLLYKEAAMTRERLHTAGLVSRVDVWDEAIKAVKLMDEIENVKLKVSATLEDLSFFTGDHYQADGLELAQFREGHPDGAVLPLNLASSPESRIYDLALEKKKAEMEILGKELYWPQFALYSNYILYGQDLNRYWDAYGDMRARTFYVGIAATIPLFDGFRNSARIERVRIETERLKVEKEKKLSELAHRYEKLQEQSRILKLTLSNQQEITTKTEEGTSMTKSLAERRIVDHMDYLRKKIELVIQRHELVRAGIVKAAAARELQMLTEVQK